MPEIAGNLSSTATITHLATVYYERVALSSLRKVFHFDKLADNRVMPLRNGKTVQFFRYSQLGANTTATPEGETVVPGQTLTSTTLSATVAQYADFMSFSDMLVDTSLDDIVTAGADILGYRAGLSVDTLVRNEIDSVAGSIDVTPLDANSFGGADLAQVRARLAGIDVKPFANGYFRALAHPFVLYDFINDPTAGGFQDVVKVLQNGQSDRFFQLEDRGMVAKFASVEMWESTNVTITAGSPNTYRVYIAGQEALSTIDLAGRGPARTEDQDRSPFRVDVLRNIPVGVANPEGKVKALVSYNFVFVTKILDTSPYRLRKLDVANSLGI